jgi:hypothetical protein
MTPPKPNACRSCSGQQTGSKASRDAFEKEPEEFKVKVVELSTLFHH